MEYLWLLFIIFGIFRLLGRTRQDQFPPDPAERPRPGRPEGEVFGGKGYEEDLPLTGPWSRREDAPVKASPGDDDFLAGPWSRPREVEEARVPPREEKPVAAAPGEERTRREIPRKKGERDAGSIKDRRPEGHGYKEPETYKEPRKDPYGIREPESGWPVKVDKPVPRDYATGVGAAGTTVAKAPPTGKRKVVQRNQAEVLAHMFSKGNIANAIMITEILGTRGGKNRRLPGGYINNRR